MFYIADLHLHSHYSRATSKGLNLESLFQWARIKGIHVVGTGDFTHPLWFKEIKEKLVPDGTGLFRLKNPPKKEVDGFKCKDIDVRFCLTSEISSIYKQGYGDYEENTFTRPDRTNRYSLFKHRTTGCLRSRRSRIGYGRAWYRKDQNTDQLDRPLYPKKKGTSGGNTGRYFHQ